MRGIPQNATLADLRRIIAERIGDHAEAKRMTVTIGTAETQIAHGLGYVPTAWYELSPAYGAARAEQSAAPDENFLYLRASGTITTRILVF